jgi:hypothetical protein
MRLEPTAPTINENEDHMHLVGNIIFSLKKTRSGNCLVPLCFISETANLFLPGFSYLCILFPGYNIHVITISALNMTGSCNAYTVDNSCM